MKIALIGYGKMGQAIEQIALNKGHEIVLKIDVNNIHEFTNENLQKADVAIEFTGPHSAFQNVMQCINWGVPVVCGSTGWLEKLHEVEDACKQKNGAFIYASNFSIGVNLFFELNKFLAHLMKKHSEYNVSLTEIHHTQKKDAPSGTAITLAEQIMQEITTKHKWVNNPTQQPEELSIISERIDPAPGTHKVLYQSPIDDIEIIHTAHNRVGFAGGAVLAAEFLKDKKGIFTMKDVLGFT
ncbi:4-hydroxy-tetrahydrodipicolinate reductase [Hydrotalea sandarakina]|jgi:4-hydroxy-tetrahydrodipicolinate reductase|uniref:4-hydroxy-tetrahydrodipicolinate reductase n=1 Tax=Hydrotalea sandarakina TaxID=1004304 RepID=A0A2W7RSH9_9BACT|nr:4-hydroxy-tetrahydrodipicolinate reductase [Hydrotalea sandarakina]PZX63688.1 dihydrodipicolinate reductase [Hydrotalea sandarakina]